MARGVRDELIEEVALAVRGVSPGIADFLLARRWRVMPPERPPPPSARTR
jgi:hypothetical protein